MLIRHVFIALLVVSVIGSVAKAASVYNLDDPDEPWRKSNSGISTQVLPPYIPLNRKDNTVECWGRSYQLGAVFPVSVTSQGQRILSGPVALKIKMEGKGISIAGLYPSFGMQREDRISTNLRLI
ncbi:MAG: hypothetical protein ABFD91_18950 [Anaerohalosphaeraceae bacterium]